MNLNWWTDINYLQRDKSLKFHFAKKVVFVPIPTISVLHAIQEKFNGFSFVLVHDLEDLSASSLSPRKLQKCLSCIKTRKKNKWYDNAFLQQSNRIERFHMTSRRPCWCTKTKERRSYWCNYFYVNTFFCFIKPIWPLVT